MSKRPLPLSIGKTVEELAAMTKVARHTIGILGHWLNTLDARGDPARRILLPAVLDMAKDRAVIKPEALANSREAQVDDDLRAFGQLNHLGVLITSKRFNVVNTAWKKLELSAMTLFSMEDDFDGEEHRPDWIEPPIFLQQHGFATTLVLKYIWLEPSLIGRGLGSQCINQLERALVQSRDPSLCHVIADYVHMPLFIVLDKRHGWLDAAYPRPRMSVPSDFFSDEIGVSLGAEHSPWHLTWSTPLARACNRLRDGHYTYATSRNWDSPAADALRRLLAEIQVWFARGTIGNTWTCADDVVCTAREGDRRLAAGAQLSEDTLLIENARRHILNGVIRYMHLRLESLKTCMRDAEKWGMGLVHYPTMVKHLKHIGNDDNEDDPLVLVVEAMWLHETRGVQSILRILVAYLVELCRVYGRPLYLRMGHVWPWVHVKENGDDVGGKDGDPVTMMNRTGGGSAYLDLIMDFIAPWRAPPPHLFQWHYPYDIPGYTPWPRFVGVKSKTIRREVSTIRDLAWIPMAKPKWTGEPGRVEPDVGPWFVDLAYESYDTRWGGSEPVVVVVTPTREHEAKRPRLHTCLACHSPCTETVCSPVCESAYYHGHTM